VITIFDEIRLWFDGQEITHFVRTGRQVLAVDEHGRIVFAGTKMLWSLGPYGVEWGEWRCR
jgi:hypothetical protein